MDYSSVFKKAGKYAGLPGFSPGISLGENLTTMERPLNREIGGTGSFPSGAVDYYNSLKGSGMPENLVSELVKQKALNENNPEIASTSFLEKVYADQNDPAKRQQILDQQLAYDQKRMSGAFPYLMAREIPRQISEGFAQNAAMTVLGARSAVDAMNETMRARTPLSFASAPYQVQKYFS
jgi:hypothetical protein